MNIIKAKEGMFLTQTDLSEEKNRIFVKVVYLATNDSEERWRDAYADEKLVWESENIERLKKEEENYGKTTIQEETI